MDLEAAFLPHYCKPESMRVMLDNGVRMTHFIDEQAGEIFEYAMEYYVASDFLQAVTRELLEEEFNIWIAKREWPEEEYLIGMLVEQLMEKYQRVQIQTAMREISGQVMENPRGALQHGLSVFSKVSMDTVGASIEVYASRAHERVDTYIERALAPGEGARSPGIYLGWPELQDATHGLKRREVAVVVGRIGIGKSWAVDKIALEAARHGAKVYLASLENSRDLTLMRLDCLLCGIPYEDYEQGTLSRADLEKLKAAREEIESIGDRLIIDTPARRAERTIFELYSRAKSMGADLFVGDQLSHVRSAERFKDQTEFMTETIMDISDMTKEMNISSIWAAQLNREAMRVHQDKIGLEHIALSDTIGQIVDWAFSFTTNKDMREKHHVRLSMIKARRAEPKAWRMRWELKDETNLSVLDEDFGSTEPKEISRKKREELAAKIP